MLVQWKEARMLGIPADDDTVLSVMPGFNEFPDEHWTKARSAVLDKIKAKTIVEFNATITEEVVKVKGKDTNVLVVKGEEFKDLKANDQELVVKDTFSVPQLIAWKLVCNDSVRSAIANRIEELQKRPISK